MRDGTLLRVNVFRPSGGGPWPVIMCAHPYGKDRLPRRLGRRYLPPAQYRMLRQPERVRFSAWTTWESPDPAFWTARGYAVVNADLRGFGRSDGEGTLISDSEAQDVCDLIEWAADAEWSTGHVGLNGVSYLAISQYKAAALAPRGLAAICPWEGFTDCYRDFARPGGIREDGFIVAWSRGVRRGGRIELDVRWEQVARPVLDEFWASMQADLERIEVPMLVCGSFSDQSLHTRGSFEAFRRVGSRQRWLYTHRGGKWATYYSPEALETQARFFDCFLRGEENGWRDEAPVRLAVHERGDRPCDVRDEATWPPGGVHWEARYLDTASRLLSAQPAAERTSVSFDMRRGRASFWWTLQDELELTGPMALRLFVEARGTDEVHLFAAVRKFAGGREVTFEGSYGFARDVVTKGWIKASHRELDEGLSTRGMPVHQHAREQRLAPGEVVPVEVPLRPSSTLFRRGDALRLDVQGRWLFPRNPFTGQFPAAYEPSPPGTCVLHCGGEYEAHLLVPALASPGRRTQPGV